jgi:hypothetical protein
MSSSSWMVSRFHRSCRSCLARSFLHRGELSIKSRTLELGGRAFKGVVSSGYSFFCIADWTCSVPSIICGSSLPEEIWRFEPCGLTSRRSQPPLALSVPLSRFTPRVGGGSAFFVRHHSRMTRNTKTLFIVPAALFFVILASVAVHNFIRMRHETASNPYAAEMRQQQAIEDAKTQLNTNTTSQKP